MINGRSEAMAKFKVIDILEGRDTLGYCNNMVQVNKLVVERIEDTDGECLIELRELNTETHKYRYLKIL